MHISSTLNPDECRTLLESERYGHLGCTADGDVYVLPVTYAYKNNAIYAYTHEGKKVDMMRKNPNVCLQVEKVDMPKGWESVICWGVYEELTDPAQLKEGQFLLAERFAEQWKERGAITTFSPLVEDLSEVIEGRPAVVYRINIDRMTGKRRTFG